MRFVGIDHQSKLLAGVDQSIRHLDRILEMHIVITSAMDEQERSMQTAGGGDDGVVIGLAMFFGQPHIALSVGRIIISPIRYWRDCYAGFEAIGMSESVKRHRSTVRPSPDRSPLAIKLWELRVQLFERRGLVFQFDYARLESNRR